MKASIPGSSWPRWFLAAALLLGLSAVKREGYGAEKPGPMVGRTAPAFQVQGIFGEPYSLATFKGHILVMQFAASW